MARQGKTGSARKRKHLRPKAPAFRINNENLKVGKLFPVPFPKGEPFVRLRDFRLEISEKNPVIVKEGEDIRDDSSKQENFLACLGLVKASSLISNKPENLQPYGVSHVVPTRNLRKVNARSKIGKFIKNHPLPITSIRGQKLLESFNERTQMPVVNRIDSRYLNPQNIKPFTCNVPVNTAKKHIFGDEKYAHTLSLTKDDRVRRNNELVVGVSTKSFEKFNLCKSVHVKLELLDPEFVKKTVERTRLRRMGKAGVNLQRIVNASAPKVLLTDILLHPEEVPKNLRRFLRKIEIPK